MELYYVHFITRYRKSTDESFGSQETYTTYYDSLPYAVQEMKVMSETTNVCKVDLACVGKTYISDTHELCRNSIPLFFCDNHDVIANTSEQRICDYMETKEEEK